MGAGTEAETGVLTTVSSTSLWPVSRCHVSDAYRTVSGSKAQQYMMFAQSSLENRLISLYLLLIIHCLQSSSTKREPLYKKGVTDFAIESDYYH